MLARALWLKILGYKGPCGELLEKLYASVLNELEIIGRLMVEPNPVEAKKSRLGNARSAHQGYGFP